MWYENEIKALKRSGRYRERRVFDEQLIDLASNDYLGLAHQPVLMERAFERVKTYGINGAKASMLVNGYHAVHAEFELALCQANGFESGVIVGSGFNANIALIEALCRKGDELFMDEKYHASGVLATRLVDAKVSYFTHNDPRALQTLLEASKAKRKIIAVEGIYSMDGDLLDPQIIALANDFEALLILDEAHSSGVVGKNLMGILDHYDLPIRDNYIKMGTLGKAYGSFGAYILATGHIIDYLINRAKPIIYATAPSLFDTALGQEALEYIQSNASMLGSKIKRHQQIVKEQLGISVEGLIVPVVIGDNAKVMTIQAELMQANYLVGAIRQPTVDRAIIRLIARLGVGGDDLHRACELIQNART